MGVFEEMEKKIKVLLADNSEAFGKPCASVMQNHGIDVEIMEKDGRQILDRISQTHPDVVIMDFFLPHLDAIGVMKGVKSLRLPQQPMFTIMSSFDNPNLEREAMQAGADYYFLKPFDADQMAERILTLCNKNKVEPLRRNMAAVPTPTSLEIRVTEIISSDRRTRPHQRVSIFAGFHSDGDRRRGDHQRRDQAAVSSGGQEARHHFFKGGTRDPPRH